MARTKYVSPLASNKKARILPRKGSFTQQPLRSLAHDTDIESYHLRARSRLINDVLPHWNKTFHRHRALEGLNGRIDDYYELMPAQSRELRRQVMAASDVYRVRKMRKGWGVKNGGVEKRKTVLGGGEGSKKWVLNGNTSRPSRLRIMEITRYKKQEGMGRGPITEGREERSKRLLRLETKYYGGYKSINT